MYLAIENNSILWLLETIEEVFEKINVTITDQGRVFVNDIEDSVSYNIEDLDKENIIDYLVVYRLKQLSILANIALFKVNRI